MTRWRLKPRHASWALVAALHGLALHALTPRLPTRDAPARQSVQLMLLPPTPPIARPRPVATTARAASSLTRVSPRQQPPLAAPPPAVGPLIEPAITATADPAAAVPAPAPTPQPSLLTTEGTRRAIRMATREPLLSERAAQASQAPDRETAQQRFGREVASSAYGNCLKGDFPGGGGGLLSLPLFLLAEASGKCAK